MKVFITIIILISVCNCIKWREATLALIITTKKINTNIQIKKKCVYVLISL